MDKFGVVQENDDAVKTGGDKKSCPVCGAPLRPSELTNVLVCPKCGTKPFEKESP